MKSILSSDDSLIQKRVILPTSVQVKTFLSPLPMLCAANIIWLALCPELHSSTSEKVLAKFCARQNTNN